MEYLIIVTVQIFIFHRELVSSSLMHDFPGRTRCVPISLRSNPSPASAEGGQRRSAAPCVSLGNCAETSEVWSMSCLFQLLLQRMLWRGTHQNVQAWCWIHCTLHSGRGSALHSTSIMHLCSSWIRTFWWRASGQEASLFLLALLTMLYTVDMTMYYGFSKVSLGRRA